MPCEWIKPTKVDVEQTQRQAAPTHVIRPTTVAIVETPGLYLASAIAAPGRKQSMFGCDDALDHYPSRLLEFDDPPHNRGAVRLTITAHPGNKVPRRDGHRLLCYDREPGNRHIDPDGQGIVSAGGDQWIGDQDVWRCERQRSVYGMRPLPK